MDIELGSSGSESTFTNVIVDISRQKTISIIDMVDGTKKVQEAPVMKRVFNVTLVKPTSTEVTNIKTEYDKGITLNFKFKSVNYSTKFSSSLDRSTGQYELYFVLQEV